MGLSVPEGRGPVASEPCQRQRAWRRVWEGGWTGLVPTCTLPSLPPSGLLPARPSKQKRGRGQPWGPTTARAPVAEPLDCTPAFRQQQLGWGCPSTPWHLCWVRGKPSSTLTPPGTGLREDTCPPAHKAGEGGLEASSPVRPTPHQPDGLCPLPAEDNRQQPFWAPRVLAGQDQTQAGKHLSHTEHVQGSLSPWSSRLPGLQKGPLSHQEAGTHLHTPAGTRLPSAGAGSTGQGGP